MNTKKANGKKGLSICRLMSQHQLIEQVVHLRLGQSEGKSLPLLASLVSPDWLVEEVLPKGQRLPENKKFWRVQ